MPNKPRAEPPMRAPFRPEHALALGQAARAAVGRRDLEFSAEVFNYGWGIRLCVSTTIRPIQWRNMGQVDLGHQDPEMAAMARRVFDRYPTIEAFLEGYGCFFAKVLADKAIRCGIIPEFCPKEKADGQ